MIETVRILLGALAGVKSAIDMYSWTMCYLRQKTLNARADELRKMMENLGCGTEAGIRRLVEDWGKLDGAHFTDEQREELIGLLINLMHGARFLTTQGKPRSSFLRSEPLLEQIFAGLKIVRKKGEAVCPGSPWILEEYLGKGSFGEVWLARNKGFPDPRAFKFFTTTDGQEAIQREKNNLNHIRMALKNDPHIIGYEDIALDGVEWPFVAFEYASGGSLEEWICEHSKDKAKLNKQEIICQVVSGLSKAHENGVFHRDLKPANILLAGDPTFQAKIGDFGLAKVMKPSAISSSAFVSRMAQVGTSMYLPPEAQDPWREHDPAQFDIFALGVIWYQFLVEALERPPYDFVERLRNYAIDSHTIGLISRCLAHPDRRFKKAGELKDRIEDVDLPPHPSGFFDVQPLVREYFASLNS